MTEWVIIAWLTGCGWQCDTSRIPIFPPFHSEERCNQVLELWIKEGRRYGRSFFYIPEYRMYGKRGGKCVKR